MSYTNSNWTCLSPSLNQGQETITPFGGSPIVINAPNIFMYGSTTDTVNEISTVGYFNPTVTELSIGDWIIGNGSDASFLLTVSNIVNGVVTVEFVNDSIGGPFLLKSANLSDLQSNTAAFSNFGFGSGMSIVLDQSDFPGGIHTLTNPSPNIITVIGSSSGNILRLPPANGPDSFLLSEGPEVIIPPGTQSLIVEDNLGGSLVTLGTPGAARFFSQDNTTVAGSWSFLTDVLSVNGQSGDITVSSGGSSAAQTVYVANDGTDAVDRGGVLTPYATLSYALSQITPTSSVPYQIFMSAGIYTETDLSLKPNITIQGNQSSLTVSGSVTLDSSWAIGGFLYLQEFENISWPSTVTFDFNAAGATFALLNISNNILSSSTTLNLIGDTTNGAIALIGNNFGFSNEWDFNITNCYGAIDGGASGDISIINTSETAGGNFSIANMTQIGNVTATTSSTAGMILFHSASFVTGNTLYQSTGAGVLNVFVKGVKHGGTTTLDNGTGGGSVNFTAETLSGLPTLLNGATYTPTSISDAMEANENFSPVNYTPVAGVWDASSITGNLAGIDAALASAGGAYNTPEIVWVDSVNGNDITADGSPSSPWKTYTAAAVANSTLVTSTSQCVLNLVGDFNESAFDFYPFVNVDGLGLSTVTTSSLCDLDGSWNTIANPTIYVRGLVVNCSQGFFDFTTPQNATMDLEIDWGTTSSVIIDGSGSSSPESIFIGAPPLARGAPEYNFNDVNVEMSGPSVNSSSAIDFSNTTANNTTSEIRNIGVCPQVSISSSSTGQGFVSILNSPLVTGVILSDNLSNLTIDSVSYSSQVTLAGSATLSNLTLLSLTDGVLQDTYTPINYAGIAGAAYSANSLTGQLAGIDAVLGELTSVSNFSARLTSTQSNVTGDNTQYTIIFDSQFTPSPSPNYNASTGVFTATQEGPHIFTSSAYVFGITSDNTGGGFTLIVNGTNSGTYTFVDNNPFATADTSGATTYLGSVIVYMSVGDTAQIMVQVDGSGSPNVSIYGESGGNFETTFSGSFIGPTSVEPGGDLTLQDAYNNTSDTPAAVITLDDSGTKPLQLINNESGSPQSFLQLYNNINPNSFSIQNWGIDYLGLNNAPSIVNYARTEAYVVDPSAGFEDSGWRVTVINDGSLTIGLDVNGDDGCVSLPIVGGTLRLSQASNGASGKGAVMSGGQVTVNTTAVSTGDIIIPTCSQHNGVPGFPSVPPGSIIDGTSFTIFSTNVADTSTYDWVIIKPA